MATSEILQQTYRNSIDSMYNGIQNLYSPKTNECKLFDAPDVRQEWSKIDNNVSHMRLDDYFLRNSQSWRKHFPEKDIQCHQRESVNVLQKGGSLLNTYQTNMDSKSMSSLRENEVREYHQWAFNNVRGLGQQMQYPAAKSHDRVQRFCDWIGVTDRYTGYRNNLSRPKRPIEYEPAWKRGERGASKQTTYACETTPKRQINRFNLSVRDVNPMSFSRPATVAVTNACCKEELSIQAQYGINTKFPGVSEYTDRFPRPKTSSAAGYDYRINPTPDFSLVGQLDKNPQCFKKETEYGYRYQPPDGEKMAPLPWNRK